MEAAEITLSCTMRATPAPITKSDGAGAVNVRLSGGVVTAGDLATLDALTLQMVSIRTSLLVNMLFTIVHEEIMCVCCQVSEAPWGWDQLTRGRNVGFQETGCP